MAALGAVSPTGAGLSAVSAAEVSVAAEQVGVGRNPKRQCRPGGLAGIQGKMFSKKIKNVVHDPYLLDIDRFCPVGIGDTRISGYQCGWYFGPGGFGLFRL